MRDQLRATLATLALAGALDAADTRILPALFRALEKRFGFGPEALSRLMVGQSLAMASAAPIWGLLADRTPRLRLLSVGCALWGVWTVAMAACQGFGSLLMLRVLAGVALAAVLPISQSLVADSVPERLRGRTFGVLSGIGNAGAFFGGVFATSLASGAVLGLEGWRFVLLAVGGLSLLLAAAVPVFAREPPRAGDGDERALLLGGASASASAPGDRYRRLCRLRTFQLIVLQGLFGAVPWNALSFTTMWLQQLGYTDLVASSIAAWHVIGAGFGCVLGGWLGDFAAQRSPSHGRVLVAMGSTMGGVPIVGLIFSRAPSAPTAANQAILSFGFGLLGLVSSWCGTGVNRPILSEIVPSRDRASVMGWSIALEGASASLFGAPIVGVLAERVFGYSTPAAGRADADGARNAAALARAMLVMTTLPWVVCCAVYACVGRTYAHDREHARRWQRTESAEGMRYLG